MSNEETAKNTDDLPHGLDGLRKLARDYDEDERIGDGLLYVRYGDWGGEERVKKTTLGNELERLADEIEDEIESMRIDADEPVSLGETVYLRGDEHGYARVVNTISYYRNGTIKVAIEDEQGLCRKWVSPDELTRVCPLQKDNYGTTLHFGDIVKRVGNEGQLYVYIGPSNASDNADLFSKDKHEVSYNCHHLVHVNERGDTSHT